MPRSMYRTQQEDSTLSATCTPQHAYHLRTPRLVSRTTLWTAVRIHGDTPYVSGSGPGYVRKETWAAAGVGSNKELRLFGSSTTQERHLVKESNIPALLSTSKRKDQTVAPSSAWALVFALGRKPKRCGVEGRLKKAGCLVGARHMFQCSLNIQLLKPDENVASWLSLRSGEWSVDSAEQEFYRKPEWILSPDYVIRPSSIAGPPVFV